jgi:hypothetical protein
VSSNQSFRVFFLGITRFQGVRIWRTFEVFKDPRFLDFRVSNF